MKPSRSELKRSFKRIEAAAAVLAELSDSDLKKFPGSTEIRDEIIASRGLKGGARKRQIKYLAKVMRREPLDDIYTFLTEIKGSNLQEQEVFHEAERLRDTLINEAIEEHRLCLEQNIDWEPNWQSEGIDHLLRDYPGLDGEDVRRSIHRYVRTRNRVHYRELFRMLKAAIDLQTIRKKAL